MPMFFVKCFSKVWIAFDHKKQYWYLDGIDDRTLLFRFWEVVG